MTIEDAWQALEQWVSTECPEFEPGLQAGASAGGLAELEQRLGVTLPEEFKRFYGVHNGQEDGADGVFDGLEFLGLAGVEAQWRFLREFTQREGNQGGHLEEVDPGVRSVEWTKGWVPFARDDGGNYYCVDLEPTGHGTVGQVMGMWLMPPSRTVLGESLSEWFRGYVEKVLAGEYEYSEDELGLVEKEDD